MKERRVKIMRVAPEFANQLSERLGKYGHWSQAGGADISVIAWLVEAVISQGELPRDTSAGWVWFDPSIHMILVCLHSSEFEVAEEGAPPPLISPLLVLKDLDVSVEARLRAGRVTAQEATEEKGYPHPGNTIILPDEGGAIRLQYGHPQEVGRNGCFMHDVLTGIIDNLSVYQKAGHPMWCDDTAYTLAQLILARASILERRNDRQDRDVHQTDKP